MLRSLVFAAAALAATAAPDATMVRRQAHAHKLRGLVQQANRAAGRERLAAVAAEARARRADATTTTTTGGGGTSIPLPSVTTTYGGHTVSTSGGGGTGGGTCPPGGDNATVCAFAVDLLTHLQLPVTTNNLMVFVGWSAGFGTNFYCEFVQLANNTCQNNPFHVPIPAPGSTNCTSAGGGAQSYASWQDGIQATAELLQSDLYAGILADLKGSIHPASTGFAITKVPGSGGFNNTIDIDCFVNAENYFFYSSWASLPASVPL